MTSTPAPVKKITPLHSGHRKRLRQRLLHSHSGEFPDYEILEVLLFASHPRSDVKPLAKTLLKECGSLSSVLHATPHQLQQLGANEAVIAQLKATREAIERTLKHPLETQPILQSWKSLLDYCKVSMGHHQNEQFRVLYLSHKHRLIADELQPYGTVNQVAIFPREIIKRALELGATGLILIHNHPSGDPTPSQADITLTKQIQHMASLMDIVLHDHLVITKSQSFSCKREGVI